MAKFRVTLEETVSWVAEVEAANAEEARRYCFDKRGYDPSLDSENNPDTAETTDYNVIEIEPAGDGSDGD